MTRSIAIMVARLKRIRDLSDDLARELERSPTTTLRAVTSALKREIDAVDRAASRHKRQIGCS